MTKKINIQKLVQENIGIDKVIVENKPFEEKNRWWVIYRESENKPAKKISFDDYMSAWLWFTDNGGRNIKTVAANDNLLKFNKNWDYKNIQADGHDIIGISLRGLIQTSESKITSTIPPDCGFSSLKNAVKLVENWETVETTSRTNKSTGMITRYFNSEQEFNSFKDWLFSNKDLKGLTFYVTFLKTKSKCDCYWKREQAKDGSDRMQLFLKRINNKLYTELTFREILSAAGDMACVECEILDHDPINARKVQHCRYAIERGDIAIALNA